jgi:glycosyltransferase involved in cell wall biosynthesis
MNLLYIASPKSIHDAKWINHFAKMHRVIVICMKGEEIGSRLDQKIPIHAILPTRYPLLNLIKRIQIVDQIKIILRENKIDLVHSIFCYPNSLWAYHTGISNHIITTRGSDILIEYNQKYSKPKNIHELISFALLKFITRKAFRKAKFVTSTSQGQQKVIQQFISDPDKLWLIRTGVDIHEFPYGPGKGKSSGLPIRIFSPRAMRPIYNIEIIIKGVALLQSHYSGKQLVELVLLNYQTNSEYFNTIKNLLKELNLENSVTIMDSLTTNELIDQFHQSDLVVMIPRSDGTPISGIEAMLCKKPLILGNLPYDNDLFNLESVWKIPEFTAEALFLKMLEILTLSEGEKNLKLEKASLLAHSHGDLKAQLKKFEALYEKVLAPS